MQITVRSLFRPVNDTGEEGGRYTAKDTSHRTTASPMTMSKLGPSGSWKDKNSTREHAIAVIPRSNNEIFFDLKYIGVG